MIDPEAVLREHETYRIPTEGGDQCCLCSHDYPCEPVQLARALQEARDRAYGWELVAQEAHEALVEARAAGVMAWNQGVEFATAARIMDRRAREFSHRAHESLAVAIDAMGELA